MKNKQFNKYYLFASLGVLLASFYPLYMGFRIIYDMISDGNVAKENYPKYIIPYTPICIALLLGVLLMPILIKLFKRFSLIGSSVISTAVFFAAELLFEKKVVVTSTEAITKLEDWQMYMCYTPVKDFGDTYKTQTPIEILMGEYNPAFKLHFYVISVLIILSVLNCLYGFAKIIISGEHKRLKSLIAQSISSVSFVCMCILACFTAFWRDGSLTVSTLSAFLMSIFFILFGMVGGIYTGSFFIGKEKSLSIITPAVISTGLTALMYAGEMILLNGHLYLFGKGFLFNSLPNIILSPFDIFIILLSGCLTAVICALLSEKTKN